MRVIVVDATSNASTALEVSEDLLLSTLKDMIAEDLNIPAADQILTCDGKHLGPECEGKALLNIEAMRAAEVNNECLLICARKPVVANPPLSNLSRLNNSGGPVGSNATNQQDMSQILKAALDFVNSSNDTAAQEKALHDSANRETALLFERLEKEKLPFCDILALTHPQIAAALRRKDRAQVFQIVLAEHKKTFEEEQKKRQKLLRVMEDPMYPEGQQLLLDQIKLQRIQESLEKAQEYLPESFGTVFMLYVNVAVNGVNLPAFIDSGAQTSIMTRRCAEKCGILNLLDTRFKGVARGVGMSRILGKIHLVQIQMGKQHFDCSITVLERGSIRFLFGLDLLRRHQCCVDLRSDCVRVGTEELPFLPEYEVRKAEAEALEEDALTARSSSQIGDFSGTDGTIANPAAENGELKKHENDPLGVSEGAKKRLMDLGFDRTKVEKALLEAGGNVDIAAELLFFGSRD